MGISHLLALLCGGAAVSICHEAWRRMCAAADDVSKPIAEPEPIFKPDDFACYRRVTAKYQPTNRIERWM